MSSWRPALRIARRTVLRSRGRSLLIVILVGLPVAGATYADVIARTFSSPAREAHRSLGSADAAVTVTPAERLPAYDPRGAVNGGAVPRERDPARVDVEALLPRGTRMVRSPDSLGVALARGTGVVRTRIVAGDVREPLHRHVIALHSGRAPGQGEALVSERLAERLRLLDDGRLRPDSAVRVLDGPAAQVSGIVRDPFCLSCELLAGLPGSVVARAARADVRAGRGAAAPTYLVDFPQGTVVDAVGRELASKGVALATYEALAHPDRLAGAPTAVTVDELRAVALVALIVALGLLEVVLLAGTAFAVGARRQVRELGLVAASGGSPRDIRRIVLAQGIVLGAAGAVLGVALGFAVAIGGRSQWERLADAEIVSWEFGLAEVAVAALVGLLSGLAAAVLPAIGAGRMSPVNALAGRFRSAVRARRSGAVAGGALVAVGAACGLLGDRLLADDFARYVGELAQLERTGGFVAAPSPTGPLALIAGGATLALVGVVLLAPALIGAIARAGGRLPLSARLAVRDAERHRHRTGPATSAIVVVVTGAVVLAFSLAGAFHADELRHPPQLPSQTLSVMRGDGSRAEMLEGARLAAARLPGGRRHVVSVVLGPPSPAAERTPRQPQSDERRVYAEPQPQCRSGRGRDCTYVEGGRDGSVAIARDDATTRLLAGSGFDAAARAALAAGEALVFVPQMLDGAGRARLFVHHSKGGVVRLPGHLVRSDRAYQQLPAALVSARTARAQGWEARDDSVLVTYAARATPDDVDAAVTAALATGALVARDDDSQNARNLVLLLVAAAAALMTLMGVAISVALSAAEGRADLATLAAVGAPPRRRRRLMASQALLVGGLGTLLGLVLGTFVAFTARATTGSPEMVVPWGNLAATGIGVPLLAALVAALCTRGRLPLVRRAE